MGESIVTFEQLVKDFPRITNKSKERAKKILPLHASPELAALVAALMTDGYVEWTKADGRPRAKKIMLYSSEKAECEWFLKIVKELFGVDGRIEAYTPKYGYFKKQPYKAFVSNATITQILILAGSPIGNKTEKEFLVPNWIMNSNTEIKKEFLKTFFTFEASKPRVKTNRKFSFEIGLTMVKTKELLGNAFKLFSQIKELLSGFRINSTRTITYPKSNSFETSKHAFGFSITNQFSIVNFYRYISYFNPKKQRVLKKAVIEISKFSRIRSKEVCALVSEMKIFFESDRLLAIELSKLTGKNYSHRQLEHFRRNESKVPLEVLFSLIKIKDDEAILNELPNHIMFLYTLDSSVP